MWRRGNLKRDRLVEEARARKWAGMQGLTTEKEEDWGERSVIEETKRLEIIEGDRVRETGFWVVVRGDPVEKRVRV
jgi:hypothetical protein